MSKPYIYISTAIDYPSNRPHLGHALEKIQADALARYFRFQKKEVYFSTGTDEHGLKIQKSAEKVKKTPQQFIDEMSGYFKNLDESLNISYDDFIRTSESRHIKVVEEIIKKIYQKGDIYKGKYKGLYCVECETYYLPKDTPDGKCPIHHLPLEQVEEETYFFKMSKYQEKILKYIQRKPNFIIPENRKKEILNRLSEPIQDLSISRKNVKWGIPLPWDKEFTLFVWIDALINYLSTLDYPKEKFRKFWSDQNEIYHIIGKDIIWHHSVIWSSLLLSAGLPLPKTIFVHGFITVEGEKMSKSLGNIINPVELVEKYSADVVRYFLLREFSPFEDGDFSEARLKERYNSDLAQGLGNLLSRVLALGEQYGKQILVQSSDTDLVSKSWNSYKKQMEEFCFNDALATIWSLISYCDKYISDTKPWEKISNKKEFEKILGELIYILGNISLMLSPIMPETCKKILEFLKLQNIPKESWLSQKVLLRKQSPLFPKKEL